MGKSAKRRRDPSKKRRQRRAAAKPELARMPPPLPLDAEVARDARAAVLDRLWSVVLMRRDADPAVSHSARLLSHGVAKVAQKFGEEAVECLIEGVEGNRHGIIAESADVLYHLIVLWVARGIRPEEIWAELIRREGMSGIAEKRARAIPALTRKIP